MKKIYHLLYIIVVSLVVSSCETMDPNMNNERKLEDYLYAYSATTDYVMSKYLQVLDYSVKLNEYNQAETQSEKNLLEDKYFGKYKIRYSANKDTCYIKYANFLISKIVSKKKNLFETGVEWELINYTMNPLNPAIMQIKCLDNNLYSIRAKENEHLKLTTLKEINITAKISKLPSNYISDGYVYQFGIDGSGSFIDLDSKDNRDLDVLVSFDVKETLNSYFFKGASYETFGGFKYNDGALDIKIESLDGSKTINKLLQVIMDGELEQPKIFLTVDGITEEYQVFQ